jgi:hypothetical protein
MSHHHPQSPALLPVLSRGKHRNPRKGACFMEFASLLAGERWSDHPSCTHPLLASAARHVNDYTSDAGRPRLVTLIPSVIGLTGDDLRIDARIALRSAILALPVVAAERQRVMAVSVLSCDRMLAELDGRPAAELEAPSRHALARAPMAAQWASRFADTAGSVSVTAKRFRPGDRRLRDLGRPRPRARPRRRRASGREVTAQPAEHPGAADGQAHRLAVAAGALGGREPDQLPGAGQQVVEGL